MRNSESTGTRTMLTTGALLAIAFAGIFLLVAALAINLPGKTSASADLMDAVRPQLSDTALAQGRADLNETGAMSAQLRTQLLPQLGQQLQMSSDQLSAYLAANDPTLAAGLAQSDAIQGRFGAIQTTLEGQQANFQQADQIPTGFMGPRWMTWLFVIPGALFVLFASYGLFRPARRQAIFAASVVLSLLMAVGLLTTSLYGKSQAGDRLNAALGPIFTSATVAQANTDLQTLRATAADFGTRTVPALAQALHVPSAQLGQLLLTSYPAVAKGIADLPAIVQRQQASVAVINANLGNFAQASSIPWKGGSLTTVFWFMMLPALFILVVAGLGVAYSTGSFSRLATVPAARGGAATT